MNGSKLPMKMKTDSNRVKEYWGQFMKSKSNSLFVYPFYFKEGVWLVFSSFQGSKGIWMMFFPYK